jgi:O-Antigen ligase
MTIIALFFLGSILVISCRSPYAAVSLITVFISLWIEWTFHAIFDVRIGLVDVAVVGGLLGVLFSSGSMQRNEKVPLKGLILIYMVISMLAFLGNLPLKFPGPLRIIWASYKTIYITLGYFLFYNVLNSAKRIQKSVNLVLLSSFFCSIIGIIQSFTQTPIGFRIGTYGESIVFKNPITANLRAFGTFIHSNEFGGFLILPLSISLTLFLLDEGYKYRKYLPLLILVQGVALMLTLSRSAWMGFLVSFMIISYYSRIYKRPSFLIIILLFPLMVTILHATFPKMDFFPGNISARLSTVKKAKDDPAMVPRYARWDYFLERSLEKPFIGHGIISDEATFEHFSDYAVSPHNAYLSIAVKRGYIALGIIILIVIKIAVSAEKLYKSSKDSFLKAIGLGIFAGIVGLFGIRGMFEPILVETQINILFWFIIAVTLRSTQINKTS